MQNLNRNGSYVERRKMYIEYPFHNMKSKVPIEWSDQNRMTYQKSRILNKEAMEKEYIKNIYNQKMERIIRDRYNPNYDPYSQIPNDSYARPEPDVLTKQVEQFNTSKNMSSSALRNNPENNYKLPHEAYHKNIQNQQNPSQVRYQQEPLANGERRERSFNDRKDKDENDNSERGYINGEKLIRQRSYNDRQKSYEQPKYEYYPPGEGSSRKSSGQLSRQSSNYRQDQSNKAYYVPSPQNSYNSKLREYRRSIQFQSQQKPQHPYHPFRNNLPDRLQQFLRERTKADRKSNMSIDLVSRQKSF